MPPKKHTRKVLQVNKDGLLNHLRILATHGILEQGSHEAIKVGRDCFYYKKGTERIDLTDEEIGNLIHNY
jgi:hypothetical protein